MLSPHLDDAVLSAGQFLAGYPGATVVTLFAGIPPDPEQSTEYDRQCGFTTAAEAVTARREEDEKALAELGAVPVHLSFVDRQYRQEPQTDDDIAEIASAVSAVLRDTGARTLIAPLGLAHPDHTLANRVAWRLWGEVPMLWLYEDLPERVLHPESVRQALTYWGSAAELGFPGTGPLEAKQAALRYYRSQLPALDALSPHAYLVPERFHRVIQ